MQSAQQARPGRAWVLNLDAEYELQQGNSYIRGPNRLAQLRAAAARLEGLVAPGDLVLDLAELPAQNQHAAGCEGDAWCPTPRALELLRCAGARVPAAPSFEVLRTVNHRAFAVALDAGPLGTRCVRTLDELDAILGAGSGRSSGAGSGAGPWLLKRALSFAGRGHRRVRDRLEAADRRWCTNALQKDASLVVEPLVAREGDYALHGWVAQGGQVLLGAPTLQHCDAQGNWQGSEREPESGVHRLGTQEREVLVRAATRAGEALHQSGYFGPFGIDAFRFVLQGRRAFCPMVELNARYSMGWALSGCSRPPT